MSAPADPPEASSAPTGWPAAFDVALIAAGVTLFLVLLFVMQEFLSPPLVAFAGALLLWPVRRYQPVRALAMATAFLLTFWFLEKLSTVLIPFVVVYLLAYLFNPLVTEAHRRFRVPRWVSSFLVTALVLGVLTVIVLLLVPSLIGQIKVLATRLLESVTELREWLATTSALDPLEEVGLLDKDTLLTQLSVALQEQTTRLTSSLPEAVQNLLGSVGSILGVLTLIGIVPVILYFTLKDYPHITRRLVELFPTFGGQRDYLVKTSVVVGNYLRGQLTISAIAAVNVSLFLYILEVPFSLLIGLLAGLLNMIPNLGAIITNIIGVLIALVFGDPWYWDVVKVMAVLTAQGLLEQSVLTPNILSHHVGLHPVLIILSLFVFGYFLGIFGLLIAVPVTALIMTVYKAYRDQVTLDLADYERPAGWQWLRRRRAARARNAGQEEGTKPVSSPPPKPES